MKFLMAQTDETLKPKQITSPAVANSVSTVVARSALRFRIDVLPPANHLFRSRLG